MVGVISPEVSMVTPRSSARGRSVSVASSAMRDRSTCSAGEGALVGAAEQEQCFGEVDRPGVDVVEAVDEFAVVAVRIVAGDVEKGLRDRQRGAQLVGGVGGESLLFGDVCLEPREEAVDGVGEILQLVAGPESARRSCRLRSEICRVLAVIARSGRRTRPATSQPSAIETTVMIASAIPDRTSRWWRSSVRRRRTYVRRT